MRLCAHDVFQGSDEHRVRPEKISRAISGHGARSCAPVPPNWRERDLEASRDPRGKMAKGGRLKEEITQRTAPYSNSAFSLPPSAFSPQDSLRNDARVRRFAASAITFHEHSAGRQQPCYPSRQPAPLTFQAIAEHESPDTCREKLADSPTPWSQPVQTEFARSPNRARTPTEPRNETQAPTDREISAKKERTLEISRTAGAGEPQVLGGHVAGTRRHHGGSHARCIAPEPPACPDRISFYMLGRESRSAT